MTRTLAGYKRQTASGLPGTIQTMIDQMGGLGLGGAVVYTGGRQLVYKCEREGYPNASTVEGGFAHYEVGVVFRPNTTANTRILVTYEPGDTYTVRLLLVKRDGTCKVLQEHENVYGDSLRQFVEAVYDSYIREKQGGFIRF